MTWSVSTTWISAKQHGKRVYTMNGYSSREHEGGPIP
jgi:hypothetical protein